MVRLVIKKGDQTQFLVETTVQIKTDEIIEDVAAVYNARLKVERICSGKLTSTFTKLQKC